MNNNTIKDIYYGNILPFEEKHQETLESKEKTDCISNIHNKILEEYPEVEELLESYRTAHYDSADYYGFQQFRLGMRLGAQLVAELMAPLKAG